MLCEVSCNWIEWIVKGPCAYSAIIISIGLIVYTVFEYMMQIRAKQKGLFPYMILGLIDLLAVLIFFFGIVLLSQCRCP